MSPTVTRFGILVGVDGSAESDAAIRWATHEAVMRRATMTLMHVVAPVAASWPMGPMYADITEWQQDNARHVLDQALKTLQATVSESLLPDVRTETRYTKPACVACKATFRALNNAGIAYLQAPVVYAGPDNHFSGSGPIA